jgi:hypothetical protein
MPLLNRLVDGPVLTGPFIYGPSFRQRIGSNPMNGLNFVVKPVHI